MHGMPDAGGSRGVQRGNTDPLAGKLGLSGTNLFLNVLSRLRKQPRMSMGLHITVSEKGKSVAEDDPVLTSQLTV